MEENRTEMRSLVLTPTWSVATVMTIFVVVSLLVERSIHHLSNMVLKTVDHLKNEIPFEEESVVLSEDVKIGLVLVDTINGFYTIGAGNLSPTEPNSQINKMIDESARLAKFLHFLIPTILENSNIPILIASLALMNLIWFLV
ncbi:hypothetical protein HYC85_016055 [Camellia sinensis]|uniref:Uncharacterized protein n=1 Tax=Camellia sinensis TaxID=4442 RepID=A0A7J7GZN7_CAMSI|nr:hypothetical protein HYC85_016055 [Camellia sinensis]